MPSREQERRNRRARERGFRNDYEMRQLGGATAVSRQSERVIGSLPGGAMEIRQSALEVVSVMRRDGVTLKQASERVGIPPGVVRFWARDALQGDRTTTGDRLLRMMWIVTDGQVVKVGVRGSHQAGAVSAHWQAVTRFLETGDQNALAPFRDKSVAGHRLETDPDVLERLALSGPLQFEDIYALAG